MNTFIFHHKQKVIRNKFAPEILIPMIPILYLYFIINKNQQAINSRQKYFHSHDTYTLLIFHHKQKATSNKFTPEIFSFL